MEYCCRLTGIPNKKGAMYEMLPIHGIFLFGHSTERADFRCFHVIVHDAIRDIQFANDPIPRLGLEVRNKRGYDVV